jgi:predicted metalloprotease with PDZ domain
MPNYTVLFASAGIDLKRFSKTPYFGASLSNGIIDGEPTMKGPAYNAGLDTGDQIISVNGQTLNEKTTFNSILEKLTFRNKMTLVINRYGNEKTVNVSLGKNPTYYIRTYESIGAEISNQMMTFRNAWLNKK